MEASETQGQQQQGIREGEPHPSGEGAKAYRALHDVTLPRVLSKTVKKKDEEPEYTTEGMNYPVGSIIHADSLTPRDKERIEAGELEHLVEPVPDEIAKAFPPYEVEPEFGVFIAEHEAEAYALEQYGHTVIPKEQEMELLSADAQHQKEYQEQARKSGLDRRPHLEAMHQRHRERVPGDLLLGAEQRTGVPLYRGAEGEEPHEEGEGVAGRAEEKVEQHEERKNETRAAPPSQEQER